MTNTMFLYLRKAAAAKSLVVREDFSTEYSSGKIDSLIIIDWLNDFSELQCFDTLICFLLCLYYLIIPTEIFLFKLFH